MQNIAQLIERMRGDGHILLEPLDRCVTHSMLETQGISRDTLRRHRFPQRFIVNHPSFPLYRGNYANYNGHMNMAII